jgi:hypothetical protein
MFVDENGEDIIDYYKPTYLPHNYGQSELPIISHKDMILDKLKELNVNLDYKKRGLKKMIDRLIYHQNIKSIETIKWSINEIENDILKLEEELLGLI